MISSTTLEEIAMKVLGWKLWVRVKLHDFHMRNTKQKPRYSLISWVMGNDRYVPPNITYA